MDELLTAFKQLHRKNVTILSGTVSKIDETYRFCTVIVDELEIPDVRLKASIATKQVEYILVVPAVKSSVLIGLIGDDETASEYVVLAVDKTDRVILKTYDFEFMQEKGKFHAMNEMNKIEFLDDMINISAGGEGKTRVSLQEDKVLIQANGGVFYLNSKESSLNKVLGKIADCFDSLAQATCPPNAPLNVAPIVSKFQEARSEIAKFCL
jgi:hypothetical protein